VKSGSIPEYGAKKFWYNVFSYYIMCFSYCRMRSLALERVLYLGWSETPGSTPEYGASNAKDILLG